ncbi:tRNA (guanosine(37)-N1)-methyltransferase TrmD [Metamycoplasma hyosynoviae]|uniref:tRNA (guanosine(37)-N1)-methyltransferase TrmD n=1 Tax=Metamycoplasma hyosynoviae TaxID=29559 RepID=UPI0023592564|nr:tRNA (guanosine(37)-N1)-methyltransferase TrmD [Metamycoplasma hyosynoviae]MDC8901285.1 tRNA (guanosine(37)-N1)-methyltransferase TrmD [Metamycoplasma hyosynoviae]MDC8912374.1 tRNA (guanosine(37)-N1)-methyltransferase TrmD [Metamycoplasma hyosynoviae]MDC8913266.1 tRNA (guanosine(37)-N1)-methyltransferase TrmD [Metamycoplasma hyosynoviae]MDC8914313.1 tRNA (guanosine(37)-N1)-methyltransferase TrmD [Metamycoplasma hyosynoviae]MDC8915357.1 tRNA (guanosine(37)-N1)-methyltransferase TrmD [Metamyc
MKINILSLFPEYFETFKSQSIIAKAIALGHLEINIIDFRNFSKEKHKKVDDMVYGGGSGMLLQVEPIDLALETVKSSHKILLSPQGQMFNQKKAHELAKYSEITLVCGHYEGFDERVLHFVDEEISIGDYILTGGEIPAMVISEAVARLCPGVIKKDSHQNESFEDQGLLDYPQYTRPENYKGLKVPTVLLSGNHKEIEKWRKEQAYIKTLKNRKDIIERIKNEN